MSLPSIQVKDLEQAFETFTRMSEKLEGSYHMLEKRVEELSHELTAARSERMQQLAEKERLADRLARLHELLPAGVVLLDGNGMVTECNPVAMELLGEPLLQSRWLEVIKRAFVNDHGDGVEYVLNSGRRVGITTRPLGSEPGQIVLLMETTEQHALRERLSRHQRLTTMGEMAASLAHQVRTPLASALIYLGTLKRHDLPADERERFIGKVIGRIRHLEHMVNDMLQFARGESFEMHLFPVKELIEELRSTLDPQLHAHQGSLHISCDSRNLELYANKRALHDVLMNLATNALQACGDKAELRLQVRQLRNGYIEFLLHDNGPGIPAHDRDKLFTPFFTTRTEGTGLGLSVARSVVLAHEGEIWLQPVPESGTGCTFGIRIPTKQLRDAATRGRQAEQEQPMPSGIPYPSARHVAAGQ